MSDETIFYLRYASFILMNNIRFVLYYFSSNPQSSDLQFQLDFISYFIFTET